MYRLFIYTSRYLFTGHHCITYSEFSVNYNPKFLNFLQTVLPNMDSLKKETSFKKKKIHVHSIFLMICFHRQLIFIAKEETGRQGTVGGRLPYTGSDIRTESET